MKKNYTDKRFVCSLLLSAWLFSCTADSEPAHADGMHDAAHDAAYVPVIDSLKPAPELIRADYGTKVFTITVQGIIGYDTRNTSMVSARVNGRIDKLNVRYNYQPVKKGMVLMEIYSPELVSAQQEMLYAQRQEDRSIQSKTIQRLRLLGMPEPLIRSVISSGKVLYRIPVYAPSEGYVLDNAVQPSAPSAAPPSAMNTEAAMDAMATTSGSGYPAEPGGTSTSMLREGQYVRAGQPLFTIYKRDNLVAEFSLTPEQAAHVKPGAGLLFQTASDPQKLYTAKLDLIQPAQQKGRPYTLTRTYLGKSALRAGDLAEAYFALNIADSWWLPATAVYRSGSQAIVFRYHGGELKAVKLRHGITQEGTVQILDDISGWNIAPNAWFIADSESFLNPVDYAP